MPVNQSTFISALLYEDAAAALAWLEEAFGFETIMRLTDADGKVAHAEMRYGNGAIMVGTSGWADWAKSPRNVGGANTQSVHVAVDDVEAHYARAKAAGAAIAAEPEEQFYGDRIYRAVDCEGHCWTFSQRVRDVPTDRYEELTGLKVEVSE